MIRQINEMISRLIDIKLLLPFCFILLLIEYRCVFDCLSDKTSNLKMYLQALGPLTIL